MSSRSRSLGDIRVRTCLSFFFFLFSFPKKRKKKKRNEKIFNGKFLIKENKATNEFATAAIQAATRSEIGAIHFKAWG
jgi:hypothetical protein